jgi:hypothetical protein
MSDTTSRSRVSRRAQDRDEDSDDQEGKEVMIEGQIFTLLRSRMRGQLAAPTNDEITVLRWLGYVESDLSVTKLGRRRLAVDHRKELSLLVEATS